MAQPRDLKGLAAILLAVASLVTAVGAVVRPRPEPEAKSGYEEIAKSLLDVQAQAKQDHDDLEALHGFVQAYIESHKVVTVETAPAPTPSASATAARNDLAPSGLPASSAAGPTALYSKMAVVMAAPSSAVPPPIAPLHDQRKPKNADAVFH